MTTNATPLPSRFMDPVSPDIGLRGWLTDHPCLVQNGNADDLGGVLRLEGAPPDDTRYAR